MESQSFTTGETHSEVVVEPDKDSAKMQLQEDLDTTAEACFSGRELDAPLFHDVIILVSYISNFCKCLVLGNNFLSKNNHSMASDLHFSPSLSLAKGLLLLPNGQHVFQTRSF